MKLSDEDLNYKQLTDEELDALVDADCEYENDAHRTWYNNNI